MQPIPSASQRDSNAVLKLALCDRGSSAALGHKAECVCWCIPRGWAPSRQLPRLSRLERYSQIRNPFFVLCCLFAVFPVLTRLGLFLLAEPPGWPLSMCKSQPVPLVPLMLCFQPTAQGCSRSGTPPWGPGCGVGPSPLLGHTWGMWMEPPGLSQPPPARMCWGHFLAGLDMTDTKPKNEIQGMI